MFHFVSIHKRRLAYLNNLEKNKNGCPKLLHNSYQNLLTWYSVDGAEGSENTNGTNSTQVFSFVVKQFERSYRERKLMAWVYRNFFCGWSESYDLPCFVCVLGKVKCYELTAGVYSGFRNVSWLEVLPLPSLDGMLISRKVLWNPFVPLDEQRHI